MKRRIAALVLVVVAIGAAPPAARAPAAPAPAWDWFTIEALLRPAEAAPGPVFADVAPLPLTHAPTVAPEPTAAMLAAFGLAALAVGRRRFAARQ